MKKLTTILMGILCLLLFSGSVLAAAPQSLRVAVLPAVDAQGWLDEDVLTGLDQRMQQEFCRPLSDLTGGMSLVKADASRSLPENLQDAAVRLQADLVLCPVVERFRFTSRSIGGGGYTAAGESGGGTPGTEYVMTMQLLGWNQRTGESIRLEETKGFAGTYSVNASPAAFSQELLGELLQKIQMGNL